MSDDIIKQKQLAKEAFNAPNVEGAVWYILNIAWFDKWKKFTGYADSNDAAPEPDECDSPPGEINNTSLMEGKQLRSNLLVNADVVFIPESLWDLFSRTYGCCHKDTEIFKRKYLKASTGKLSLDLYPSNICLVEKNNKDHKLEETFCNAETIGHLKSVIRKARHYEHCDIRLFDPKIGEEVKAGDDFTLQEACLDGTRTLFYEVGRQGSSNDSPNCSRPNYTLGLSSSYNMSAGQPRGVVGLHNLGNTCFMNSALQCISNVPQLTDFFLSDKYKKDLNRVSRLGSEGVIAERFADLIKHLWSTNSTGSAISPRELKISIGHYAPQFVGYQQHDAHELMVFLLDFLHEDLNRVQEKPYIELEDSDGRPDEKVAKEAWDRYKKRNDSFIVDLFHGMLKSTVVCPECNYTSVTFDPFASLSLPLDVVLTNAVILPSSDEFQLIPCRIYVPPRCSCEDLLPYVNLVRQPGDNCKYVIAEVNGQNVEILEPEEILNFRKENHTLFAFEVPSVEETTGRTTNCTNGLDSNPSEPLCDEVLKLINAYLSKEGFDQQAGLAGRPDSNIVVPPEFFKLSHTAELQRKLDLDLCFELFTTKETLSAQNEWYCKKCREHKQASKKFDLWSLPKVLVIHLKRFRTMFRINKINEFVDCPLEGLKIRNSRNQEHIYDLVAVSNHMGGLGGGHYTAYAKNRDDNRWYNFDDSFTCHLSRSPITEAAYVLIYVRREPPCEDGDNGVVPSDRDVNNEDGSPMNNSDGYSNGDTSSTR